MDTKDEISKSIILIGPSGVGKSEMARWLSNSYNISYYSADIEINDFFRTYRKNNNIKAGDLDEFTVELCNSVGVDKMKEEWERFRVLFVTSFIDKLKSFKTMQAVCFGSNQTVFTNEENFKIVQEQLSTFDNVIYMLPSDNVEESVEYLKRFSREDYSKLNKLILESTCNNRLSTKLVYTKGLSLDEIFAAINDKLLEDLDTRKYLFQHQFEQRIDCEEQVQKQLSLYNDTHKQK